MRYWIFQNNQVLGPHDIDELSGLPYFSTDSLVCPEGRKGTSMGDWQRAGLVPELSLCLVKASQLSMASRSGDSSRVIAGLPPEPTLKDLAALGSLQEKVSFLENTLSLLQGELRMKDTELSTMHIQLEDRGVQALELKKKLEALESKLGDMGESIKENLQKAVEEERGVASDVETQRKTLEGLTSDLGRLRDELRDIEKPVGEIEKIKEDLHNFEKPVGEIERIKEELHNIEQPVSEIEKIKEELQSIGKKMEDAAAAAASAPPASASPAPAEPAFTPAPVSSINPISEPIAPKPDSAPAFQSLPDFTPAAVSAQPQGEPAAFPGMPDTAAAEEPATRLAMPADAAAPVVDEAVPPAPKKSKKVLVFAVVGIALAGVAATFLGLIPLG
ncbi:MAG: hypothetical protein WC943_12715, partial [Elusimicrobiota bacterium]